MPRACRAMPRNIEVQRNATSAITAGRTGSDRRVNAALTDFHPMVRGSIPWRPTESSQALAGFRVFGDGNRYCSPTAARNSESAAMS
jgi:hypothetical protein